MKSDKISLWKASREFLQKHNLNALEVYIQDSMAMAYVEYWSAFGGLNRRVAGIDGDKELECLRNNVTNEKMVDHVSAKLNKCIDDLWNKRKEDDSYLIDFIWLIACEAENILNDYEIHWQYFSEVSHG